MKKIALAFLLLGAFVVKAQEVKKDTVKVDEIEQLKQEINIHSEKFNGLDERLSEMGSSLDALKKLKISGYVQAQYEMYDWWTGSQRGANVAQAGQPANYVNNSFFLRRARVKFTYEAAEGVKFVLQPNFDIHQVTLKDAYVQLNDRWTKTFALWVGQFNRTSYEVEFSSSMREFAERTQVTRTLYPTERDQGAKLEANFNTKYNFPLKMQVALFNGSFGKGLIQNQQKDIDNTKDVMARATYSVKLPSAGLGIDFGAHGYFGNNKVLSPASGTMPKFTNVDNIEFTPKVGDNLKHQWFGGEAQVYYDFLGGLALKAEYLTGTFSTFNGTDFPMLNYSVSGMATGTSNTNVNKVRDFQGGYLSLIKNVGKNHKMAVRYDVFDPNTKVSGDQVSNSNDLKYNNWTFAYEYFFDENIKIQLTYNMPMNEKSKGLKKSDGTLDVASDFYGKDKIDNTLTLRLQARF